jgi:hypothetical protein
MNIMRCIICDEHRERTPSGWCKDCTVEFHRVLRVSRRPRLSDPGKPDTNTPSESSPGSRSRHGLH